MGINAERINTAGIKTSLAFAALSVLLVSAPASATTFNFSKTDFGGNTAAGEHKALTTTFNNNTDLFTWSSTFGTNSKGKLADGAWLVVNGGGNPKSHIQEYTIFYLDGIKGKVTAYDYVVQITVTVGKALNSSTLPRST